MLTAIVGINWGDEGKGRMVDLLSEKYEVVVRYQGGNNAGHTVVNDRGRFILNLMPSGILREGTVNVLGPGMVIDVEHLCGEVQRLREELEQAAWTILEESGQLGIGLGADCTVPADIDDGRLAWVQEAAAKYANR